jgi:predicted 2-oxoglutarate/Fe(II)-dependent dioxygenase YbiX
MKKNLSDYVVLNKGVISEELCDLTVKELEESNSLKKHLFHKYENEQLIEYSRGGDPENSFDKLPTSSDILMNVSWEVVRKYVQDDIDFHWFSSWQGFTGFKYIRYTADTEMHKHCDHIHSLFEGTRRGIPILTMISLFNDDFTGGDFIMFDDEKINLEKGDILIFPSIFTFPHTVEKLTSGTRYSAASWVF